jgi:hypothetical protein
MIVKAAPGLQCPKEGKPRQYITDDPKGVEVTDSPFIRRLIDDGSLIEVTPAEESAPKASPVPAAPAAENSAPEPAASAAADPKEGEKTDGK